MKDVNFARCVCRCANVVWFYLAMKGVHFDRRAC